RLDRPSFPTRRSSDLGGGMQVAQHLCQKRLVAAGGGVVGLGGAAGGGGAAEGDGRSGEVGGDLGELAVLDPDTAARLATVEADRSEERRVGKDGRARC